ncbi:unnamed protein product [Rhizophagus irregularis]|nr:unnamed protein product [Rhizophagus irregularis]
MNKILFITHLTIANSNQLIKGTWSVIKVERVFSLSSIILISLLSREFLEPYHFPWNRYEILEKCEFLMLEDLYI